MLDVRIHSGVEAFNTGEYFKAHEIWESAWREALPPEKDYYKALIQAAVALHHLHNGNVLGAHRLAGRALKGLDRFAPVYFGLDTRQLREFLYQVLTESPSRPDDEPATTGHLLEQRDVTVDCLIKYSGVDGDE